MVLQSCFPVFQPEEKTRLHDELEEAKDKARRRSIGNIKFIGELFKLKMLTEAIMHDCVVKLLKNHDEESLECLCRLLTTIGKDLDFEKAKVGQEWERGMRLSEQSWKNGCGLFLFEDLFFLQEFPYGMRKSSTPLWMFRHDLALLPALSWILYHFQLFSSCYFQRFYPNTQPRNAQHFLFPS